MGFSVRNRLNDFCDLSSTEAYRSKEYARDLWTSRPKPVTAPKPVQPSWQAGYDAALKQLADKVANGRLEKIERAILDLREHCKQLKSGQSITVPITSFTPEPFEVCREILAVVQPDGDSSYIATFFDANINASGDTQADAIENLKDMLITTFRSLVAEKRLGKGATRRLEILKTVMRKKG